MSQNLRPIRLYFAIGVFSLLFLTSVASAVVRTDLQQIAMLGGQAPVTNDDEVYFHSFQRPMINDHGDVAFIARIDGLSSNPGNDGGIWTVESGVLAERIREGQVAPGTTPDGNTLFSNFQNALFNDNNEIGFQGSTNRTEFRDGYWVNSPGNTVPLAVTNTAVNGHEWEYNSGFYYASSLNNQGQMAINLSVHMSGDFLRNDGIFIIDPTAVDIVALEDEVAPGTTGHFDWIIRTNPPINESGKTAFLAPIQDINTGQNNSTAIYTGNSESLNLLALTDTAAPGTDAVFSSLQGRRLPINGNGDTAFVASLKEGTTIPETDRGIWRSRNGNAELVARKGDVALAATESSAESVFSHFSSFSTIDDTDQVLFSAYISGEDGTALSGNTLWSARDGELTLLLQEGMPAPGTDGTFAFGKNSFSTNRLGQAVVWTAVDNKYGIWAQDPAGELKLIVRAGDMLEVAPGELRMVTDIDPFGSSGGSDGRSRIINDAGQIVFLATFEDGSEGIFVSDAAGNFVADFDGDGDVDADDLNDPTLGWQTRFGNDLNGADFLAWQRQFGSNLTGEANEISTVPEPTSAALLLCTLALFSLRKKACLIRNE